MVLVSLLLTLDKFQNFSGVCIVDFEQVKLGCVNTKANHYASFFELNNDIENFFCVFTANQLTV